MVRGVLNMSRVNGLSMIEGVVMPDHVQIKWSEPSDSAQALAQSISQRLDQALTQRGRAVLSVSGGRSPVAMFECLAQADIDWHHVTVTLVDERQVAEDHPASNALLVRQHLLQDRAAAATFSSMVGPLLPTSAAAWQARADQVDQMLHALGPADVTILGMGLDGHFASWFSQAAEVEAGLDPSQLRACMAVHLPQPPIEAPFDRMSQTLAHLSRSGLYVLPITGAPKLKVWIQACAQPGFQWPISAWLSVKSAPFWLWITP
jgi:6-phosphogluconolactonase